MDTTPPLPQLIRLRDVAKLYGVVPRSVERWIEQGRFLPPLRDPGGNPYWLAEDVAAYVSAPEGRSPDAPSTNGRTSRKPVRATVRGEVRR